MRPFHPVTVRFGPPVICTQAADEVANGTRSSAKASVNGSAPGSVNGSAPEADPDVLRRWTDTLMTAIASLSAQEYVDEYASRSKAGESRVSGPREVDRRPNAQGGAVDVAS